MGLLALDRSVGRPFDGHVYKPPRRDPLKAAHFDCQHAAEGRSTRRGEKRELIMAKTTNGKKNKPLSKSGILQAVGDVVGEGVSRKHVKEIVEALVNVGHKELKKNGIFVLPGFAKFVVVKKPARPAREGINPFTKEKQMFAAKPASKAVRARPVKAVKDAVS
jgi:DNA-binding protein HU-beta